MSNAEWALVLDLLLAGRGGRPERICHRQMIDAVGYLVDNGIKWRATPSDFPWPRVDAFSPAEGIPDWWPSCTTDRDVARSLLTAARNHFRQLAHLADGRKNVLNRAHTRFARWPAT
jgi:hypothetical protein